MGPRSYVRKIHKNLNGNFKSKALPVEVEASDRNVWSIVIRLCFRKWYRAQNLVVVPHGPSNHVCSQVTNLTLQSKGGQNIEIVLI